MRPSTGSVQLPLVAPLTTEELLHIARHTLEGVLVRDVGLLVAAAARPDCAVIVAFGVNGWRVTLTDDEAYDLVIAVATGALSEVADIAARAERSVESF